MGNRAGTLTLCVPFKVIEPVMSRLATQGWLAYQRKAASDEQRDRIIDQVRTAEVQTRVFLAETTITVNDLVQLQLGDIIQTAKPADAELVMQVRDKPKFAGRLYQHKGVRALRVTRPIGPNDRL